MTNVLRPTITMAAIATTIAVLLAAGCGSSSNGGTASASAKSPMVAKADAICKTLNERRNAANKEVGAVTTVASLKKVAELAPFIQAYEHNTVIELRRLTLPSALAPVWRKILTGTELLSEHAGKIGTEATAKSLQAVEALIHEDQKTEKELLPLAIKAGFKHCGRNA